MTLVLSGPSFSFVTLTIPGITNPSTTAAVSGYGGTLTDLDSSTQLDNLASSGALFTPTPKSLTAATISVATGFTNTVGSTIDILLAVTYASTIEINSVIVVSFPKWERASDGSTSPNSWLSSSIACENEDSSASLTWTYTTGSGSADDVLTISGLITSQKVSGDTNTIRIKNFINYSQLAAFSVSVYVNTASGTTTNSLTGVVMQPTQAADLSAAAISVITNTVNAESQYFFSIRLTTILPIGSYIRVTLPSEISNKNNTGDDILTSVSMSSALNSPTVDKTGLSLTPQYFDLTNIVLTSSNYRTKGNIFYIQIDKLLNPPNVATSGSFTIALYDSSNNLYESKSSGITVTANPGALTEVGSPSISATSTSVLDSVNFTMSLQSATALSSGSLASIVVTFPSEFTLTTGAWALSALTGFSSSSWAISGQVVTISNFASDSIDAGESFSFTIGDSVISLPSNTATSSTFTVATQISGSTVDSISTITWAQTTVGALGLPSPITDAVIPSSYVTYTNTTYTFKLFPPHAVEQNAVIKVTFPSTVTLPTTTTCASISNIGSSPTWSISGSELTVSNGYSSGAQAFTGSEALSFTVSSVLSPRSLEPTSTFLFEIKSSGGDEIYKVTNPTLTMTTTATFGSAVITPTLGTNGASTSYTWTLTTNSKLVAGDFIKITPPSTISFSSSTWTGTTSLAASLTWTVSSGNLIVTVAFARRRNLANGDPGSYAFRTTGVTNGPSTAPSGTFTIQTIQSDNTYLIEQTSTPTVTNTQAGTITSSSVSPGSVALSTAVSYTITFTPINYVQGMTLKITLPSDLSISDGTNTWTNIRGLTDATFSWQYTSASREILVTGQFTGASNPGEVSLEVPSITNPSSYGVTNSFLITTYHTVTSVDYSIDQLTSGLTANISCDATCLTCSGTATFCLTWDVSTSNKYLLNNQWLTSCPEGYYASSNQWLACDSSCKECSGEATTCTAWDVGKFLFNNQCLSACPTGYKASGTECVEETSSSSEGIIPFPFLIISGIMTVGVLVLKWIKKVRFLPATIALVCIVELVAWIYLWYFLYDKSYKMSTGIVAFGILGVILTNFIFIWVYFSQISKDRGFKRFKKKGRCCHWFILSLSVTIWHRFFRFSYSYFGGSRPLGGILTSSIVSVRILSVLSIWLSSLPVFWAWVYNLFYTNSKEQAWWTDLEVAVLSIYSIILITFELLTLPKYKLPRKEREFDDIGEASLSGNDLLSNNQRSSKNKKNLEQEVLK